MVTNEEFAALRGLYARRFSFSFLWMAGVYLISYTRAAVMTGAEPAGVNQSNQIGWWDHVN